jgi:hypothetical protein
MTQKGASAPHRAVVSEHTTQWRRTVLKPVVCTEEKEVQMCRGWGGGTGVA